MLGFFAWGAIKFLGVRPTDPAPARRGLASLPVDQKTVVALLVGGVVLTALLAAVAVTAISVAVATVVLRSLLRERR
ncbi:hypothetical protein [Streptomyces lavenduligriseus]|uniref:hypothetical protein n=1 Tax=Streptomyces lavenduligriseus TaxID=67315 RepID=UPI0006913EC9|nr:hypothetical protein [Streptomyces lavenduligriseus]